LASASRTLDGDSLSVPGVGVGVGLLLGVGLGLVEWPGGGEVEVPGADEDADGADEDGAGPVVPLVVVAEGAGLVADPGADGDTVVITGLDAAGRRRETSWFLLPRST